jgi:metallopeptidase MepB
VNVPLFREAIILRDEAARMLGYPNHASFRIKDMMAPTPEAVLDFLSDLQARLKCKGLEEIEHLKDLKKQDFQSRGLGASYDGTYYIWDDEFYKRLMIEKEYLVDQQKVADYFPLLSTVERMFRVFEKLFGLNFVEIVGEEKSDDIVWHKDVLLFSVWDDEGEGGAFSGYLYLDLYPRPGKYGHAAQFSLQPGFLYPDGSRRYPTAALVCNFSKPTTMKPGLLNHKELVTLFHELGHGIHDLVGRTTYSSFHGTSVVRDFVEAPSQMLENWCWIPSVLKDLSNHYETRENIANDLTKKLIQTRYVNDASNYLGRIFYAIFDSVVHTPQSHEAAKSLNIPEQFNMLRTKITGLRGPEDPFVMFHIRVKEQY